MAFTCTVDKTQELGVVRVSGAVDVEELLQIFNSLLEDPAWEAGYNILWDGTRITELVVSRDEMQMVAEASSKRTGRIGPGKTAIVVTGDKDTQLVQLFTAIARDPKRERKVFSSLTDAQNWLDETASE